jgi:hypothetical protein
MGRRVLTVVLLLASAVATVAIFAVAPTVFAALDGQTHSCGGG